MFVHRRLREGGNFSWELGLGSDWIGLDWIGSVRQERVIKRMLVWNQPPRIQRRSRHRDFMRSPLSPLTDNVTEVPCSFVLEGQGKVWKRTQPLSSRWHQRGEAQQLHTATKKSGNGYVIQRTASTYQRDRRPVFRTHPKPRQSSCHLGAKKQCWVQSFSHYYYYAQRLDFLLYNSRGGCAHSIIFKLCMPCFRGRLAYCGRDRHMG